MASLNDSAHSPHAMLVSQERQGVNLMLLTLKAIETRLKQNGHRTTFSEDGIYLTYGRAKVNCESTLKVEQLLRAFKKRMNEELKDDAKETTVKKPRLRACTPVPSPSDWQESNISRHATDGQGWDVKTEVTASKRQRATKPVQHPADDDRVDDKHDPASITPPNPSTTTDDGDMSGSTHVEVSWDKLDTAFLTLPPNAPRMADDGDVPDTIASPP